MGDILHDLRGGDYGTSVQRSLRHMEAVYAGSQSTSIPGISEELNEQIVEEIIFLQQRGRASYNKGLNCLQEMQLLEMLLQYFKCQLNERATRGVFRALFGVSPLPRYRADLLQKFVSMAIAVQCASVLDAAAVWMQLQGCGSEAVTSLVRCLAEDYCVLTPHTEQHKVLASLPNLSQHFTCNFITAITHIYQPTESPQQQLPCVPPMLLQLLTTWLSDQPQLCLHSLHKPVTSHRLWTSPTKPNNHTPIPGLVSWVTTAPLLSKAKKMEQTTEPESELWSSRLHLALLECIVSFPAAVPGAARLELLTLGDMTRIVRGVAQGAQGAEGREEARAVAVERVGQVLQVALSTGAFRCSLADLKSIMNSIPENRLLHILAQQHLSIAPPQMHNVAP